MPDHTMPRPADSVARAAEEVPAELRILLLEDHTPDVERIERELARVGLPFKLRRVMSREALRRELHEFCPDILLTDAVVAGLSAVEAIALARQTAPAVPVIVVSAVRGDEAAAECIKAGADDYLLKDRLTRLGPSVGAAIAYRHAAEEAEACKRHCKDLLELLPEGVVELDARDRIVYANKAFCDLVGVSSADAARARGGDVLGTPETTVSSGPRSPERYTVAVQGASGERRLLEVTRRALPPAGDGPRGSVGIVRDVTAQTAEERARREDAGRFATVFQESPVPMCIISPERGEYVDVNRRFLDRVGLRREEVVGRTAREAGLWGRPEDLAGVLGQLERGEVPPAVTIAVPQASGGTRFWRAVLRMISFGGRRQVLTVLDDVTERLRAEETLRDAERRFAMFSDSAFEGIVVIEKGKIADANEQLARMLGYNPGELVGMDPLDVVAPGSKELVAEMIRSGSALAYELVLLRRDGSVFPAEARGRSFTHGGEQIRVTAIRDITERRQHEALIDGQRQVLELIAKGTALAETLEALVKFVEEQSPEMICAVLRADPDGIHVRHAAAPSLPPAYLRVIEADVDLRSTAACGTAAFRGERVVAEDIATDPRWEEHRQHALAHGLHACWAVPIFDPQRRVLGTLAVYFRSPRRPLPQEERLVEMAAHTAAIAMLKHEREEALRLSEEKFSRAFQQSPDSITISRMADGKFIEVNEGFERISGYTREEAVGRTAVELGIWRNERQRAGLVDGLQRDGFVRQMDFDLTIKGGAIRACQISAERLTIGGEECLVATTRDVTEKKKADEELLRKGAEVIETLERVTDGFVALDKNWCYTYVNAKAGDMFRRDPAGLIGKHIWTEFPEGIGAPFHLAYEKAMREQRAISLEDYFPAWDRWFENRIYPSPDGLSIYFRDITDRKRSEELLRESEVRYQRLLESVEGIVWEADPKTLGLTFVSNQAERLLGYPVAQWTAAPSFWRDHLHPDDRERALEYRSRQGEGAEVGDLEYRMIHADGHSVWLRDIAGVVAASGRPKHLRGLMIDISGQKQATEALRSSEARFRAVAETATAAIFVYRGDEFLYVNAGAAAVTGYPVDELAATKFFRVIHPDFHELVRGRGDLHVPGEGAPSRYELKLVTKSGQERWVHFSTGLMEFDGKRAALGVAFDITDRKLAEEQLQRTTEQLRALSAHLQFVREEEQMRISREIHDQLGQAMTGLRMDVSWIAKRLTDDQGNLKARADGMRALIDETIQTIRRISSELRPAVLDNLGLVPALDWHAKEFQNRTGIACELRLPDASPALDAESSNAVFRIFQETLTNIARHSGADRVTIALTVGPVAAELEVVDNGKGISPGDVGKSLGLVGMRERAMNVGGSVSVTGKPGKGTRMHLRVPLQRAEQG